MIHDVDEVLKGLVGGGALAGSGIDVSFDVPSRDWAARRNAPVINAYLYDIREDVSRRQRGHQELRDTEDVVVRRRRPPRWFRLSYLVTAWRRGGYQGAVHHRVGARRVREEAGGDLRDRTLRPVGREQDLSTDLSTGPSTWDPCRRAVAHLDESVRHPAAVPLAVASAGSEFASSTRSVPARRS
ncbi:Pvc16 family protein [Streptomyces sp. NPDC017941]|uniref:Pvc16 family protein n=1 Tax=Streptomyces sp. NPDC017941 TaxID=3365018 RepID=UPI0037B3C0BB